MCRAFPGSDYYEGSVTIGVSPRRPSRVPFDIRRPSATVGAPFVPLNDHIGHRPLTGGAPVTTTGQCNEWRRVTSVLPAGGNNTIWELGFRQSSFHRIARALRNRPYKAFRP